MLVRKARRVAGRADAEVDRGLDVGMDRLHALVSRKLGSDSALHRASEETKAGRVEPTERTRRRLVDGLEDAVAHDRDFSEALARVVAGVPGAGPVDMVVDTGTAAATGGGRAGTGVVRPQGAGGGMASAQRTGDAVADGSGSRASTGVDYG